MRQTVSSGSVCRQMLNLDSLALMFRSKKAPSALVNPGLIALFAVATSGRECLDALCCYFN